MSKPGNPADRRQFGRRQNQLLAWISVPGRPRLPCSVKNISVGGALLALEKPHWLPFNFQLTIEATRFVTWCEVRHQAPGVVGVRFLSAVEASAVNARTAANSRSLDDVDAWKGNHK